jgi:hypothetical protein
MPDVAASSIAAPACNLESRSKDLRTDEFGHVGQPRSREVEGAGVVGRGCGVVVVAGVVLKSNLAGYGSRCGRSRTVSGFGVQVR